MNKAEGMNDDKVRENSGEYDELHRIWNERLGRVELAIDLNAKLFSENRQSKISKSLRRFLIFSILDIIGAIAVLGFLWTYLLDKWPIGNMLVPTVSLLAMAYLFLAVSIYCIVLVARIDFSRPVVENQLKVEKLKAVCVKTFKWIILLSPWIGFSFLMIVGSWLTDFQIFQKLDRNWIIGNFIFGILFVPIGILTAKFISKFNSKWLP